jgi:hypothetical protein
MKQYLLFIIILLFIIVLIILQFDITRYIRIKYYNEYDKSYIINYSKIPKINTDKKVIISLTTTPHLINKIKPTIKSLLDQSVKVDEIVLNIPENSDGLIYNTPEIYKDMVTIKKSSIDYGKSTSIIPTLLRECNECIIISLEDKYIYGYDFIESIVNESIKNNNRIIISKGAILFKPEFFDPSIMLVNEKICTIKLLDKYSNVKNKTFLYYNNL